MELSTQGITCKLKCSVQRVEDPRKKHFHVKCEILREIFQPRALSSGIQATWKGVYLFHNPPLLNTEYKQEMVKAKVYEYIYFS